MLVALPEYEWIRYELVDGEVLVSRAPGEGHTIVGAAVASALFVWNRRAGGGWVMSGPGVLFGPNDAAIPDVVWVSHSRRQAIEQADRHLQGTPELIVEVASPGRENARRDRDVKLEQYSRFGVAEYWSPDPRTRTVQVYRHDGTALRLVATLGPDDTLTSPLLPGFAVRVADLFPRWPA